MSDKEDIEEASPRESARATEPRDTSDIGYEELLARMRALQKKVKLMGTIDPDFDMKHFSDELSDELEK
ncbi:hypothetical protein J7413_15000 [Shimia sp. R10_1]|uniref:hypothetical protein n=1 Tax=Shimia sp. R10_1 TaxID=2821095 RepID=UPI001ADCA081|nr:hypothetical protein [Shimia sp. R10_1]MBO9474856.1 hypothetical protein [Shimia sp. R10_1]